MIRPQLLLLRSKVPRRASTPRRLPVPEMQVPGYMNMALLARWSRHFPKETKPC